MKRTLFFFLMLLNLTGAAAQKKKFFFDDIYFSVMAGNESFEPALSEWKKMYTDRITIPYFLDTMKVDFMPKCGIFINFNIKGGGALMASKRLINKTQGWFANKDLEWRTGLYYKQSNNSPSRPGLLSDFTYPYDTTRQHVGNYVKLNQEKQILEWQNIINFKTGSFLGERLRFNIGSGLGISRTVKNTIHETYWQTVYSWDSNSHNFIQQSAPAENNSFKAKAETNFSYVLYLGTELNLSKHIGLLSDFHYTIAHYKYSHHSPKIESFWVGLTCCYHIN